MNDGKKEGKIITFYSFKGGVGRTMALANVAFLAAQNGLRVLVMDWDLEAPGLAYYFRGLLEAPDAKMLKDVPGVLDILWDWSGTIKSNHSKMEIETLINRFEEGEPFQSCVQHLLESENIVLDFIGAGSQNILTPEPRTYEEALAYFSWSTFFEEEAGGHVIVSLRKWAKRRYDIVLLDSRTGLADVAGICTMQIPDTVALCFILNRQNIDGIAKVAASIRAYREDALALRAVPMRVARQDTSEESDARARAIWELTRIGGFSNETVQNDFRELAVLAADNVPFYETLAPFTASNPNLDPLTLNYLGLAVELLGKPLENPTLDSEWIELVRRRLQPRHATVDYIAKLKSVDPVRAVDELQRLIESAFDTEIDGGKLDDDYLAALVEAVLGIGMTELGDRFIDGRGLQNRTLDLLRILVADQPTKWQALLTSTIERYLGMFKFELDPEEVLALLEELDGMLAQQSTIPIRLKRINYRREAARLFVQEKNDEAVMQTIGEIQILIREVSRERDKLASDQIEEINTAEVEVSLLTGDVHRQNENFERAYTEYQKGLDRLAHIEPDVTRFELRYLAFALHSRFAEATLPFVTELDAAKHAVQAVMWGSSHFYAMTKFTQLARVVLNVPDHPDIVLTFCENILSTLDGRIQGQSSFANYFGRQFKSATNFLAVAADLFRIIGNIGDERAQATLMLLTDATTQVLRNLNRRKQTIGEKERDEVSARTNEIMSILKDSGLSPEKLSDLEEEHTALGSRRKRKTPSILVDR